MSDSSTSVSAEIISATRARQAVVVAEADLVGRDRVVLVDHRHGAERQQRGHGLAGIEIAAALLGVVERQQDLRHGDAVARQRLLVGVRELDLAGRGGGLALLELQRAGRQLEMRAAEADGAGGDQHDLAAALCRRATSSVRASSQSRRISPLVFIDQDRGADLDDQPARALERCHAASRDLAPAFALPVSRCLSTSFISSCSSGCTPWPEHAGDDIHGLAAGLGEQRALGLDVFRRHGVGLVERHDLLLAREIAAIGLELGAHRLVGAGDVVLRAVDQVQERAAALDMAEEARAEPGALAARLRSGRECRPSRTRGRRLSPTPSPGCRVVKG